ncbi:MAG: hypothetical protein A2Y33_02050 [Spirochaetes bacterium GWF1_51_8]|nr:MAG: hypothetical protein A2Y33_02050 [Spirochaetes bacterium GWF1_51_8]
MKYAIDAVLQVRMDSSRLPGKAALPILGKPLVAHIIERLTLSEYIRHIIIATTEESLSPLRSILADYDFVKYFAGSKDNVLDRFHKAAKKYDSDFVVRVTGDNPLTDPDFLDKAVEMHLDAEADLTHYLGIPLGTGVEVISADSLAMAYRSASQIYDLEHVTPYLYKNRQFFKVLEPVSTGIYYEPNARVTVDTQQDYYHVNGLFEFFAPKPYISMEDIVHYCRMTRAVPAELGRQSLAV